MVKTKTTNGTTESGPATQRHFVRAVDNDMSDDHTHVVCAFTTGHVSLAVGSMDDLRGILDRAAEWDGEPSFDLPDENWQYNHSGQISVDVSFE